MLAGRAKLPLLAEISGSPDGTSAWSLRRADMSRLEAALLRLASHQVVLVAGEGEAPVPCAVAVAAAAAASGRRTLLLECDVVRPRLAALLGLAPVPGLHEYLRWESQPPELLQPVALGGPAAVAAAEPLVCVTAGRPASDPTALFGLQSFAHMTAKLRGAYDFVVLAGPPVAAEAAPALAVARQADAVVAGLAAEDVSSRGGRRVRAAVRRLPVPALGAIAVAEQVATNR
jgi:Mrp family chromosome partitioning ATPase